MTKDIMALQSLVSFLRSEIIRQEVIAERMNSDLQDLHLRLEEAQIQLADMENEEDIKRSLKHVG